MVPLLGLRLYEPAAAVAVALLVALLAVRALGQTDLNPVSGVGKLSQVVFALIAPRQVIHSLSLVCFDLSALSETRAIERQG